MELGLEIAKATVTVYVSPHREKSHKMTAVLNQTNDSNSKCDSPKNNACSISNKHCTAADSDAATVGLNVGNVGNADNVADADADAVVGAISQQREFSILFQKASS